MSIKKWLIGGGIGLTALLGFGFVRKFAKLKRFGDHLQIFTEVRNFSMVTTTARIHLKVTLKNLTKTAVRITYPTVSLFKVFASSPFASSMQRDDVIEIPPLSQVVLGEGDYDELRINVSLLALGGLRQALLYHFTGLGVMPEKEEDKAVIIKTNTIINEVKVVDKWQAVGGKDGFPYGTAETFNIVEA